ncbi:DUF4912 domain-containing protein [Sulfurihydrogenibium subterraneum]|uniref:DUF4912 domain-containing protein n=1 Tax=Sulfurihydrogenibium subterraneum TaxID=171121 RepID=UPI0004902451|nr:DUF4912 domain-containing protein [Sulfurihydrogenibium subterraneum]
MNEIIKLSIQEDNLSSHILHTKDEVLKPQTQDYQIPVRFDITKIVILPVNPSKFYTYWFIKEDLKKQLENKTLRIKLFVENQEVLDIPVSNTDGEMYLFYHAPFKEVFCILCYLQDSKCIEIARSNVFVAPSDIISQGQEEVWYNKAKKEINTKPSIYKDEDFIQFGIYATKKHLNQTPTSK